MRSKVKVNEMFEVIRGLSDSEKQNIVDRILSMMQAAEDKDRCSCLVQEHIGEKPDCPHCKAKANMGLIIKRGVVNGTQRFYCKACGRRFVSTTNTAFERSRKSADTWRKFIRYTIEGKSLAYCSEKCKIAYQTAFTWRHKILNVFNIHQEDVMLSGNVQMDEMLVRISYKGNHVKGAVGTRRIRVPGEESGLPRKSYKRGTDNKPKSSAERACVVCLVGNGGKKSYGAVPGVGFMKKEMLDKTLGKHIEKENAHLLVDQYKVTVNYLFENRYSFTSLAANVSDNSHDHKPEIRGENREIHLQNVNAMHRHIRQFLAGYYGVSSKYLENYIALYMWIRNIKANRQNKKIQSVSLTRAATSGCYISWKNIHARPSVPGTAA